MVSQYGCDCVLLWRVGGKDWKPKKFKGSALAVQVLQRYFTPHSAAMAEYALASAVVHRVKSHRAGTAEGSRLSPVQSLGDREGAALSLDAHAHACACFCFFPFLPGNVNVLILIEKDVSQLHVCHKAQQCVLHVLNFPCLACKAACIGLCVVLL